MGIELPKEIGDFYPDELLTRKQYAERVGVAARTIGKYVQRGIIPLWDDQIWPEQADKLLDDFLVEPLGSGRPEDKIAKKAAKAPAELTAGDMLVQTQAQPKANTYADARTIEKRLKIELLQLEVALKKGQMVLTEDVENAAFSAARELRDRMLNIPDRVAAIVAAMTDETKVRDYITAQIENELTAVTQEKFNPDQFEA